MKIAFFASFILLMISLQVSAQESMPKSYRHDFVKKGDQPKDMAMGNYIVVARTLTEADAIKFIDDVKKLSIQVPQYGYQSNQSFWFIYFDVDDDIEKAHQKKDELKENDMYKSAYLLTIHGPDPADPHEKIRHEFISRGSLNKEMEFGTYVIAAVFQSEENARRVTRGYKELDFKEVTYQYSSEKRLWYVFLEKHEEVESAKTALLTYRNSKMLRDSWLLTIHQ